MTAVWHYGLKLQGYLTGNRFMVWYGLVTGEYFTNKIKRSTDADPCALAPFKLFYVNSIKIQNTKLHNVITY